MIYKLRLKNNKLKEGFTLVETLVAITILLIAIMGPMTLAKQGIMSSRSAKNQVIAFYLAQDAIEQIRNVRDTDLLSSKNWTAGLGDCMGGNKCKVDSADNTIKSCGATCEKLRLSTEGLYGYDPLWGLTKFRRTITITPDAVNSDEVSVLVEMQWANDQKSFKIKEDLFNI